jgi:hypothetical protein
MFKLVVSTHHDDGDGAGDLEEHGSETQTGFPTRLRQKSKLEWSRPDLESKKVLDWKIGMLRLRQSSS